MSDKQQNDLDLERVQAAVNGLAEHFDTVQVFCTRVADGAEGTINIQCGAGNWFARFGHVRCWMLINEEAERSKCREVRKEQDE